MFLEILFLFLITILTYQLFIRFAKRINLLDVPNSRSSHRLPVVRGFGAVIFFSIGITLVVFKSFLIADHLNLLIAVLLIGLLGLVDDIKSTKPIIKISTLTLCYLFLYTEGFLILNLGSYLGLEIKLHLILAFIFSLLSIVAFTNAFNLIDGLDGLSGLVAAIIFLTFFSIGLNNEDRFLTTTSVLFITSLLIFIFYNWHPAKVFLGDSGSLMIGFVISLLAVRSLNYIQAISILYITAVPIIDFLFVTIRRLLNGSSIFIADRSHCHHILLSYFKGNVKKTVILISIFQTLSCLFGIIFIAKVNDSFLALVLFVLLFVIIYKFLTIIETEK